MSKKQRLRTSLRDSCKKSKKCAAFQTLMKWKGFLNTAAFPTSPNPCGVRWTISPSAAWEVIHRGKTADHAHCKQPRRKALVTNLWRDLQNCVELPKFLFNFPHWWCPAVEKYFIYHDRHNLLTCKPQLLVLKVIENYNFHFKKWWKLNKK